jgi:hypothetical protein
MPKDSFGCTLQPKAHSMVCPQLLAKADIAPEDRGAAEIAVRIAYGEGLLRRRFFNATVASTASLRSPPVAMARASAPWKR